MKRIERLFGGGQSWWYVIQDGKVKGAANEDDLEGMRKLQALIQKQENKKPNEQEKRR